MPFSQQSYTGQGIVQQNVTPRAGEIIGASLANMGQSIGAGIEKFAQRKEENKRKAAAADGLIKAFTNLGILDQDEAKLMSWEELTAFGQMAPQLLGQKKEQQQQSFLSNYAQAQQPQQVTEDVDFSPQLAQAQGELDRTISANQFRPEFVYPQQASTPPPSNLQQFYGQPGIADKLAGGAISAIKNLPANQGSEGFNFNPGLLPQGGSTTAVRRGDDVLMREEMRAMRKAQPTPQPAIQPSPVTGPMGPEQMPPEPEEITSMRNKLAELQIQAAEGDTRTRPENQAEYQKRIQSFMIDQIKENPAAASYIADQMMGQKLTPSDALAQVKHQREVAASTVPGFGDTGDPQIAKEFRTFVSDGQQAYGLIGELIDIANTPGAKFSPTWRTLANNITKKAQAKMRTELVGVGAVNESEWKMLEDIIANPTKWTNLKGPTIASLQKLQSDILTGIDMKADAINWIGGRQNGAAQPTQPRMRYNPSTGKVE